MDDDPTRSEPLRRAVRSLTVAVWCLVALLAIQLSFYAWGYLQSMRWMRGAMAKGPTRVQESSTTTYHPPPPEENLPEGLPLDQLVARSTVVLLTSYQDDGDRWKAVVAEIVKRDPGVELHYSVGDEYPTLSFAKEKGVTCGEGQVVFMVGNPASMRRSYGFDRGRVGGLGDIQISKLREIAKGKKV
jgi:hypothetical protein